MRKRLTGPLEAAGNQSKKRLVKQQDLEGSIAVRRTKPCVQSKNPTNRNINNKKRINRRSR